MLHSLPLTHVYGVIIQFLANGWGLATVLLPQFEPTRVLEAIERYRVRYLPVVPTMLVYLLNHPERERFDTSSLFRITSGGAPLADRLRQEAERVFRCRIDQGYGLSESAAVATGYALEQPYRRGIGRDSPRRASRFASWMNRIRRCPRACVGEICLAGPNISPGYWKDPEATGRALAGGWLHTGDIGYVDEDGYLYITDRKKDLIIKGGENISPREIEEALYLASGGGGSGRDRNSGPGFRRKHLRGGAVEGRRAGQRVGNPASIWRMYVTKFKLPAKVVFMRGAAEEQQRQNREARDPGHGGFLSAPARGVHSFRGLRLARGRGLRLSCPSSSATRRRSSASSDGFVGRRGWRCRWRATEKPPHGFERRGSGRSHPAQLALNGVLKFLVVVEGGLQIPHDEVLARAIGGHDELAKQFQRQAGGLLLGVLHDDLGERHARQVFAGFGVHNFEIDALADHFGQVVQVDVAAGGSVVEPPVFVLLDGDLLVAAWILLHCTMIAGRETSRRIALQIVS